MKKKNETRGRLRPRRGKSVPPNVLRVMKWLAVGGLSATAVVLVMKPKKAY